MKFAKLYTAIILFSVLLAFSAFAQVGTGSVSGHVYDGTTGQGIQGAIISAYGSNPATGDSLFYTVQSAIDGSYIIDNMLPGFYRLFADAPNYIPGNPHALFVDPGVAHTGIDFVLNPAGNTNYNNFVEGTVFDSQSGVPINGVLIDLMAMGINYNTISDSSGFYHLENILPGSYDLFANAPGYFPYQSNNLINVDSTSAISGLDIYLTPDTTSNFTTLQGMVLDSLFLFPIYPVSIELSGLTVNGDTLHLFTVNNPSGEFIFHQIEEGIYDLTFEAPRYKTTTITGYNVVPGQNFLDVYMMRSGSGDASLSGSVTDENGMPIPFATIEMMMLDSLGFFYYTYTDSFGNYQIANIPTGFYDITASAQGYLPETVSGFEVVTGPNMLDFQLTTVATGIITGTVTYDSSGAPVVQAMIDVFSNNGTGSSTITDVSGNYSIAVPAGEYIVACHVYDPATGFPYTEYYDNVLSIAQATPVQVIENNTTSGIDFGIPEGSFNLDLVITGQVMDANFNPLENALIKVQTMRGDSLVYTALSNAQGFYVVQISNTSPFLFYIASASKQGYLIEYWQEAQDIFSATPIFFTGDTLIPGIDFTLDPVTPGNNSISGTVTDDFGIPIPSTFVVGSNLSTGQIHFIFSDNNGDYTLGGLQADPFIILFAKDGFVPEFYDDVLIWENATPVFAQGVFTGIDASLTSVNPNGAPGMVAGIVTDLSGVALSGVLLTIKNNIGQTIGYDFTDAQGGYQIIGLENGDYTVQATKISYTSESQLVNFNPGFGNTVIADFDLNETIVSIGSKNEQEILPSILELAQNYPNPFNPVTTISFTLPDNQNARLTVYNLLGQAINVLVNETLPAGEYHFTWNGTDARGIKAASGIYFYSLEAGDTKLVRKMLLNK